jgi:phage-related protein
MKGLYWLGTSLDDVRGFPAEVRREIGTELFLVQRGLEPTDWKPMASVGGGVREIRIRLKSGAWRVLYVVESDTAVYVLHAFRKTTQKTARSDIDKGRVRYALIP